MLVMVEEEKCHPSFPSRSIFGWLFCLGNLFLLWIWNGDLFAFILFSWFSWTNTNEEHTKFWGQTCKCQRVLAPHGAHDLAHTESLSINLRWSWSYHLSVKKCKITAPSYPGEFSLKCIVGQSPQDRSMTVWMQVRLRPCVPALAPRLWPPHASSSSCWWQGFGMPFKSASPVPSIQHMESSRSLCTWLALC